MEPVDAVILGQRFVIRRAKLPKGIDGICDPPGERPRAITLRPGLKDKRELAVLIHEMTHGAFWWLDEEFVQGFADDVADILFDDFDYRRAGE